jgi:uncharacterized protein (TIGR02172 family)
MTLELGQPIAYGRTAEIYAWHQTEILKLFYDWFGLENIENEARISRAIHASGLPTQAVGEIICLKDRYGLVYERVNGVSMWKMFQHKPWNVVRYAHRWAELQAAVHASTLQFDLPSQQQLLGDNIHNAESLPTHLQLKALAALEAMPNGDRLCHGDFWPGNILVAPQGEIIIDWIHASHGNPLADLARSTNLIFGFIKTRQSKRPFLSYGSSKIDQIENSLLQIFGRIFYPIYLNRYFKLCPGGKDEYHRWLPIIAAARLSDNIPELKEFLTIEVKRGL